MLLVNGLKGNYSRKARADRDSTVFYVGAVDGKLNDKGYIIPG